MLHGFGHGMVSFQPHIAVFLGLIALAIGYQVLHQAKSDACCGKWGKFVGVLVSAGALLGLVCVGYLSVKKCCSGEKESRWLERHIQKVSPPSGEK